MDKGDNIGYLLKLEEGVLSIRSAYNFLGACTAPGPSVTIEEDYDVFDEAMTEFIRKYML